MPRARQGITKNCVICDTSFYLCRSEAWKYSCCSRECGRIRRSRLKTRLTHGLSDTPEMRRLWMRRHKLKQKYNMTLDDWEVMFNSQQRHCAACATPDPQGNGWHTDHNHKTGQVRGILCAKCNLALGHVHDSVSVLHGLIRYLESTN